MKYEAKLFVKLTLIFLGLLFLICVCLRRRETVKNIPEGDRIALQDVRILLEALDIGQLDLPQNGNLTYGQYMDIYQQLDGEALGLPEYAERYEPDYEMLRADWYTAWRILLAHLDTSSSIWETTIFLIQIDSEENKAYTENSTNQPPYSYCSTEFEQNMFREMRVYVKGNQLLTVIEVLSGEHELNNVWVMESGDGVLECFYHQGIFQIESDFSAGRERIVDLTFRDGRVMDVREKNEKVNGKLLWVSGDELEIEGKGVYEIEDGMEVYRLYGSLKTLKVQDLKIGYEDTDYVIEKGKICACLVSEKEKADRIRVLLKNTAKSSDYYDKVELVVDGERVQIEANDLEQGERRTYRCSALTDKITVNIDGVEKADNAYRGTIECYRCEEGIVLINELPLEEYLYAVVPSEMPASYPAEALKAQAVCARTYAYLYILHAGIPQVGAHVDDTTSYQVYHNSSENAATTTAVKETDGMLLTYQGEPAQNYYYSTSCGVGTNPGIWKAGSEEEIPYIQPVRMNEASYEESLGSIESRRVEEAENLRDEDSFRQFITSVDDTDFEKDEPWYRWTYRVEEIDSDAMLARIVKRYQSSPESVLTKTEGDYYVSQPVKNLGEIQEISIARRGAGGVAEELLIVTDTGTYKILSEYNIRSILCDGQSEVIRQDGSSVVPGTLIPSGFFVIESGKDDKNMVGYTLIGGGYGHGVGMSQNGARTLGEAGASYQNILEFFFTGCRVDEIGTFTY